MLSKDLQTPACVRLDEGWHPQMGGEQVDRGGVPTSSLLCPPHNILHGGLGAKLLSFLVLLGPYFGQDFYSLIKQGLESILEGHCKPLLADFGHPSQ